MKKMVYSGEGDIKKPINKKINLFQNFNWNFVFFYKESNVNL